MVPPVNKASTLNHPLVCFDLDGTLVDETIFIWSTLHEHFATDSARRNKAREDFFAGRIPYEQWFRTDLELLDEVGTTRESMVKLFSTLPRMPGALEVLQELRGRGHMVAIVSGSVDLVVETLFPSESFDALLINRLEFSDDGRLIGGTPTPYDLDRKADGLIELARRYGLSMEQTAFIGDNSNDTAIARAAGLSIAFNCKSEELAQTADVVITEHDLRAILRYID